jgi:hypothetical protein
MALLGAFWTWLATRFRSAARSLARYATNSSRGMNRLLRFAAVAYVVVQVQKIAPIDDVRPARTAFREVLIKRLLVARIRFAFVLSIAPGLDLRGSRAILLIGP